MRIAKYQDMGAEVRTSEQQLYAIDIAGRNGDGH